MLHIITKKLTVPLVLTACSLLLTTPQAQSDNTTGHNTTYTPEQIGTGAYKLQPDKTLHYKTVSLGETNVELAIHAFLPQDHKPSDKRPAAIFFHGGGWHGGTPDQFYPQCRYLALRGMPTFTVEYRTINRFKTTPAECVIDGKSAVRWIRSQATQLGIDPNRIAVGGGSAGGHIAAATAFCPGFLEPNTDTTVSHLPNALILYNPVFDNGPNGFAHGLVKPYWRNISPIHNIGNNPPPSIILTGEKDKLLPVATVKKYQTLIQQHGGRCDLHIYPGKEHAFFNLWVSKPDLASTIIHIDNFLTSLGYLAGSPILSLK